MLGDYQIDKTRSVEESRPSFSVVCGPSSAFTGFRSRNPPNLFRGVIFEAFGGARADLGASI